MASYLIDTHIYIWLTDEPECLPPKIDEIVKDNRHQLILSLASIWEMQIKYQLGKLELKKPLADMIEDVKRENLYQILPVTETHILNLQKLAFIHKDPFDRLLVAQAMTENLTILTVDEHIVKYPISFIS